MKKKRRKKSRAVPKDQTVHPWRLCPIGKHFRHAGQVKGYTRKDGTIVRAHSRGDTCAENPSGMDQLYPEEMKEMAERFFAKEFPKPLATLKQFKEAGNKFDSLIQGWTRYWNDVLKPAVLLDPDVVKALIASESGFRANEWNKLKGPKRARGLMQVTDETLPLLSDRFDELKNHFLNLTEDDVLDPNLAICAGVRWLFRKRELAKSKKNAEPSWEQAVAKFKGVPVSHRFMDLYREKLSALKSFK